MEKAIYVMVSVVFMGVSFFYARWDERRQIKIREKNWQRFLKDNNLEERIEEMEEV